MATFKVGTSLIPPYKSKPLEASGLLSFTWEQFFRSVCDSLNPLGTEKSFQLQNNMVTPQDIEGMQFDGNTVNYILIEYFVQRFYAGNTMLVEGGTLRLSYNAKANTWSITELSGSGPNDAGVTFAMSSAAPGQVQYTTSNITTGAEQVNKITWRARTLFAKVAKPAAGWPA